MADRDFRAGKARLGAIIHGGGVGREPVDGPFDRFFGRGGIVPLYLVARRPPVWLGLRFFVPHRRATIIETPRFRKELARPPAQVRESWAQAKARLEGGDWSPGNLKRMVAKGHYRYRLAGNYRVVLRHVGDNRYEAIAIAHRKDVYRSAGL